MKGIGAVWSEIWCVEWQWLGVAVWLASGWGWQCGSGSGWEWQCGWQWLGVAAAVWRGGSGWEWQMCCVCYFARIFFFFVVNILCVIYFFKKSFPFFHIENCGFFNVQNFQNSPFSD
jgi:hypothetical protein